MRAERGERRDWQGEVVDEDNPPGNEFPEAGPRAVAEPALYTVGGRQTADLQRKCNSALIRKAKLPRDREEGVPSDGDG
jgi:hypothetical protein